MEQKIHYKIKNDEAQIIRCHGNEEEIVLPSEVEGLPVTGIAPYAFSAQRRGAETGEAPICGSRLRSIELPPHLKSIGNYAFYDCRNLEEITITSPFHCQIGGGAFIGCSGLLEITVFTPEGKSCLKDILDEVRHEVHVVFQHEKSGGRETYAKLYFPEYFEEAVENTPARILETHTHGSGCHYRQCFHEGRVDYKRYDSLFYLAAAQESCEFALLLAMDRLCCPFALTVNSGEVYTTYAGKHAAKLAELAAQREKKGRDGMKLLKTAAEAGVFGEHNIEDAISAASRFGDASMVSYLLDYRLEKLRPEEKKFEL